MISKDANNLQNCRHQESFPHTPPLASYSAQLLALKFYIRSTKVIQNREDLPRSAQRPSMSVTLPLDRRRPRALPEKTWLQRRAPRANFTHTPRDLKELDRDVDAEKENQKGDDLATRMGTRMGTAKPQKNGDMTVPYVMT